MINAVAVMLVLSLGTAAWADSSADNGEVININTATAAELAFLPGIGPSRADAIIRWRTKRKFVRIEQIMRVKGIGRKGFRKMRPYLTVKGETTVTKKIVLPGK